MLQQLMRTMNNNPLFHRAQQMAAGKSEEELKQTAMNLCKQMGFNFEEMQNRFNDEMKRMQEFAGMMNGRK